MNVKKITSIVLGLSMMLTTLFTASINPVTVSADIKSKSYYDDFRKQTLTGKSAKEIVDHMTVGWNLGNTFDSTGGNLNDIYSFEQNWGCPKVTKTLIDGVAAQGFDTIRIPVTWCRAFSDKDKYIISDKYLARVKEVVDWAYDNDMYVIINMHHEEWLNNAGLTTNKVTIGKELVAIWKQVADYFGDYDQHLIFEGMNEPRYAGAFNEWGGDEAGYDTVNYLNKKFVKTIRKSKKKNNKNRALMIPAYAAANSGLALKSLKIPKINGKKDSNIIIEAHCYSPSGLGLDGGQKTFDPNNASDTSGIDTAFESLDTCFLSKGIPAIIDETSAVCNNNTAERAKWAKYMASNAAAYGIPLVIWDNGSTGNGYECHGHVDRNTGKSRFSDFTATLINTYRYSDRGSKTGSTTKVTASSIGGELFFGDSKGIKIEKAWSNAYVSHYFKSPEKIKSGKQLAVVYTGSSAPHLILVSEPKQAWWIDIAPTSTGKSGTKKVAYYSFNDISKACKDNNVEKMSELSRAEIIGTDETVTFYELALVDEK